MSKYENVFVVDDDKIYRFILKNLFRKNNILVRVNFFENGFEAIQNLKVSIQNNFAPDLILLDLNMPVMDGWQFLDEFKILKAAFNLSTEIHLVTSSNDILDLKRAKVYENEITKYYLKPISKEDIYKIFGQ
jgi:CheY-like chemotaxis protein